MRTTSRHYRTPYRPWPVALANRVLAPLGLPPSSGLAADALRAAAARAEGLDPSPDPELDEPLDVLCASLREEARLTPLGRLVQRQRLIGLLRARLRLQHAVRGVPAPDDEALSSPLVITGLPRTGTTFLHRLLAADPRLRALRSWEAIAPAPLPDDPGDARRRAAARRNEQALRYLAPDFFAVHPIDAEGVEEEVLLLDLALRTNVAPATCHVPAFEAWLATADRTPAYALLRQALGLLSAPAGPRRWVLKTPDHLPFLDVLASVFPGARVIHTHRHPRETTGSFASMVAHAHGLCTDAVDPERIGRSWLTQHAAWVRTAQAHRDQGTAPPVLDVRYDDLMADPLREVARIYAFAGLALPDDVQARIAAAREAGSRHAPGRHRYALEDFGLSAGEVDEAFADYVARFDLAPRAR
ncbi:MAG: sulfotransferase [Alphaproteobacteria bacterium]|nr:sulfotransferase [Alphaproteobacteria bacterium]